jgi:NADPH:quinone reductase-like Zn-dependent oxidoreductase
MKAIGFQRYGVAEVLEEVNLPEPTLAPNQLLIQVAAAGVNPADWRLRAGQFKFFMRPSFPFVPGSEIAGIVADVGSDVTRFRPGHRVYAMLPTLAGGGYAQYVAVHEKAVALAPAKLTLGQAAAVPLTALTALQALVGKAQVQPNMQLLIYGASGGVGHFAVQIARTLGAKVIAVCSQHNVEWVRGLGADQVIDYTKQDVTRQLNKYEVVFDAVNQLPLLKALGMLRRDGKFVSVNPILAAISPLSQLGLLRGRTVTGLVVKPCGTDLENMRGWLETGQVRPIVERYYPLAEAAAAHRHSESKRVRGKLVLVVDERLAMQEPPTTGSLSVEEH